ncbi:MAG: hypothetical protein P9M14_12775 [Candidatus Alcyoniella australis]|nr:hypothetical protein [Candidatus Alcyoniella australis]
MLILVQPALAERFQGSATQTITAGNTAAAQERSTLLAKIDALMGAVESVLPQEMFEAKKAHIRRFVSADPDHWIAMFEVLDEGVQGEGYAVRVVCEVKMVALRVALDEELAGKSARPTAAQDLSKPGPLLLLMVQRSTGGMPQLWELQGPMENDFAGRGYAVLDREIQGRALQSSALDQALRGELGTFCSVARALGASYLLLGLGSGNIADSEGVSCTKEVQVRFVHAPTCRVISAISVETGGIEGSCAQRMELVGRALVERVVNDQQKAAAQGGGSVLIEVLGIRHHDDYVDLAQALSEVPGVESVSLAHAVTGRRMGVALEGDLSASMLGAALDKAVMPHFRISLQGVQGERVVIKCVY